MRSGDGAALRRTAVFTVLYVAALEAGRLSAAGGTVLGLMWPAAGVGTVWLLAQRRRRSRGMDALLLASASFAVNLATGVPLWLSVVFTVANLGQTLVFLWVFARLCPDLWNSSGLGDFDGVRHLWGLLAASLAGALFGALVGSAVLGTATGQWSPLTGMVWLARNVVSIVTITALGLRVGRVLARRAAGLTLPDALGRVPGRRIAEFCLLVTASAAAYVVTFSIRHDLPLAFLLVAVTVWAAVRFGTTFVALHDLVLGTAAIVFTLYGVGPFALIAEPISRVLVAQVFVGMVSVIGLALALSRDEREALLRRLAAAEKEASEQAGMLTAIVESMHDGLAVIDAGGVSSCGTRPPTGCSVRPIRRARPTPTTCPTPTARPSAGSRCRTCWPWPGTRSVTWTCSCGPPAWPRTACSTSARPGCRRTSGPRSWSSTTSPRSGGTATSWRPSPVWWPTTCSTR
nr:hypothetical protein GCM10020093_116070 [Planobispora longispora]